MGISRSSLAQRRLERQRCMTRMGSCCFSGVLQEHAAMKAITQARTCLLAYCKANLAAICVPMSTAVPSSENSNVNGVSGTESDPDRSRAEEIFSRQQKIITERVDRS